MHSNNYLLIQGWMVNKLHLSGNELLCYALIFGFCQDGNSVFSGTASYIADWLGIDKRNVYSVLSRLVAKGLIQKQEKIVNGVKLCDYKITSGVVMKHQGGSDETSHHNINDNNRDKIKENNIKEKTTKKDVEAVINNLAQNFKSVDAVVGKVEYLDGMVMNGIQIKNPKLQKFIRHRFSSKTIKRVFDWATTHNHQGFTYNANALLKLFTKFQSDEEKDISFNFIQNEYINFE